MDEKNDPIINNENEEQSNIVNDSVDSSTPIVESNTEDEVSVSDSENTIPSNNAENSEPAIEDSAVEQPTVENNEAETNNTEIIIDNTAEAQEPSTPAQELNRKPKLKEPLSKKKKITIISIAVATIIVLCCAIVIPCVVFYHGKVMVSKAEDFNVEKASGKYFVLNKDIVYDGDLDLSGLDSSIDLNGHDLIVNGKLIINTESTKDISIGTKDKNTYKAKGLLTVNDLEISAPNSSINLASTTIIKGVLDVNSAKQLTVSAISIGVSSDVTAENVIVNEAIAAANSEIELKFTDCANINIKGIVTVENTYINGSAKVVISNTAALKNVSFGDSVTAEIYGKLESITGGKKIAMLQGHKCNNYSNIALLAIYRPYNDTFSATNIGKAVYIDKLETPVDLIVEEYDGKFVVTCGKIEGFKDIKYAFTYSGATYKDQSSGNVADNIYDITSLLKSESGATLINLSVKAIGNYNFDNMNIDTLADGEYLYLDSDVKTMTYSYSLILSTPTNLKVTQDENDSNIINLEFDPVNFADYYMVYIDGNTSNGIRVEKAQTIKVDIAKYVKDLGYHSIRVTANSDSKELKTSKEAMVSYKTTQTLDSVSDLTATYSTNESGYTVSVNFTGCSNGKIYIVKYNGIEYRVSNQTTLTFDVDEIIENPTVQVYAEGYNYYNSSKIITVDLTQA